MPFDDGLVGLGQVGMGLDGVEFAGFDQGGEGRPVCGPGVVAGEDGVFAGQGDGADGAFDGIVVNLDPAVGEEQAKASPVICAVIQRLAQGGYCGYAGAVVGEPCLTIGDLRRGPVLANGEAGLRGQAPALGVGLVWMRR